MEAAFGTDDDGAPNVTAVRALALLCQQAGVHELEASDGHWSVRLILDLTADRPLGDELPAPPGSEEDSGPFVLHSDWVGVFRRALYTDSEPIVQEGQPIREGDVVGLIEAMQLMHEQRTNRSGVLERFLVEDGAAIEYGQPLAELQ